MIRILTFPIRLLFWIVGLPIRLVLLVLKLVLKALWLVPKMLLSLIWFIPRTLFRGMRAAGFAGVTAFALGIGLGFVVGSRRAGTS